MNPASPSTGSKVHPMTRRRFLAWSGVAGGAVAAGAGVAVTWNQLLHAAHATPLDPAAGVLVVVTLYGGNDGLNTVVPAGDPAYQQARPDLAYKPEEVLDLGDGLGFNPGLKGLKGLWDSKSLAVIRGTGYPKPDRSHFRSMAIWQTAAPDTPSTTGWLGRWLDGAGADPMKALSLDPVLPPLLAGEKVAAAALGRNGLAVPSGKAGDALKAMARPSSEDGPWQAAGAASVAELIKASETFNPAVHSADDTHDPSEPDDKTGPASTAGGQSGLARQLDLVASLVELGVPTRVYSVSLGGFDTHSDERGTQQRLLGELDAALSGFAARLAKTDRGAQVVTMVYSEFGRRVHANASQGTDHGTAGPMFVLGRGVQDGFYGAQPSLTDLDDGDLKFDVDFRDVYATMLDKVLGADPGQALSGWTGSVDKLIA